MTRKPSKVGDREDPRLEAARRRLRESVSEADALEGIREVVTNLLGCEEIGIFVIENDGHSELLWSFGIDKRRHGTLESFKEFALDLVMRGEVQVVEVSSEGRDYCGNPPSRAFVPISLNGRTVAVLVLLRLLPQKLGFDEADIKIVKLISAEAGRSLFPRKARANA